MPLTLPTHPLAGAPLKLWRPRWFDGVALFVGAIAPDVAYAFDGYGVTIRSHTWPAAVWWAVPVALIGVRLIRWSAPTVAAHLPHGGRLALRDYGALGAVRHPWWITVVSAIIGALSHIAWDALTHPTMTDGAVPFPALREEAVAGLPWWQLLSLASDGFGFVAGAALAVHIGQRRLIRTWHGPAPAVATNPPLFWMAAAAVLGAGLAALPWMPVTWFHDQAVRTMLICGAALLAGTAAVRLAADSPPSDSPPPNRRGRAHRAPERPVTRRG